MSEEGSDFVKVIFFRPTDASPKKTGASEDERKETTTEPARQSQEPLSQTFLQIWAKQSQYLRGRLR